MNRHHVHASGYRDEIGEYDVSLTVYANSDEEAQAKAWKLLPELDVEEIEAADPRDDPNYDPTDDEDNEEECAIKRQNQFGRDR